MLKQRVITACIISLVVLAAIFVLPPYLFVLFVSLVALIGAWEWSVLAGFSSRNERVAYCVLLAALFYIFRTTAASNLLWIIGLSLLWWILALVMVVVYPRYVQRWANNAFLSVAGFLILFPVWLAFIYLRSLEHGGFFVFTLLVMVAAADISAYFSGKTFGQYKLAPRVSPNKTWEGAVGGVVGCCLIAIIFWGGYISFVLKDINPVYWFYTAFFAVLVCASSIVGDLTESMVKRVRGVKDSGNLLPGHGGMLDRIDGFTAAAPVYLLMVLVLSPGAP